MAEGGKATERGALARFAFNCCRPSADVSRGAARTPNRPGSQAFRNASGPAGFSKAAEAKRQGPQMLCSLEPLTPRNHGETGLEAGVAAAIIRQLFAALRPTLHGRRPDAGAAGRIG